MIVQIKIQPFRPNGIPSKRATLTTLPAISDIISRCGQLHSKWIWQNQIIQLYLLKHQKNDLITHNQMFLSAYVPLRIHAGELWRGDRLWFIFNHIIKSSVADMDIESWFHQFLAEAQRCD